MFCRLSVQFSSISFILKSDCGPDPGRAASGGALALESPRTTRSQPESPRIKVPQPVFSDLFDFISSYTRQAEVGKMKKKDVFGQILYELWRDASGGRRLRG